MKVLVLLASYNGESYIKEQIDSILGQSYADVTIYVRDDVSEDNTVKVVRGYGCGRVKLLESCCRSGSAGQNFLQMIAEANCLDYDYVAFSDQDDIWYPDKLSRGIRCLEALGCDAYSSNVQAFWADGRLKLINKAQSQRAADYLFEAAGPGCTYILKSSVMYEIKRFVLNNKTHASEIWLHDWFVYAYVRSRGYKWFIDPKPSMLYRQHVSNQVGVNEGLLAMKRRLNIVFGGEYASQIRIMKKILDDRNCDYLDGSLNLWKRLRFLCNIGACRRRFRDRLALALMVLTWCYR